jgi:FMN phosphatase YigB (HAD superfamily)
MATWLVPNRTLAVRVGYVATDWTQKPTPEAYEAALSDWDVKVIARDGLAIGAAYFKGPEFHVSILPEWRRKWLTRGLLKELIAEPVSVTRVTEGHEYMHGILKRLGFEDRGGVFVREVSHGH